MFVERPCRGDDIRVLPSSQKSLPFSEGFFVLLSVPAGGMIFESSKLTKSLPLWRAFCFVERPLRRDDIRVFRTHKKSSVFGGLFCFVSVFVSYSSSSRVLTSSKSASSSSNNKSNLFNSSIKSKFSSASSRYSVKVSSSVCSMRCSR